MKTPTSFIALLWLTCSPAISQDVIPVENPSFETELADVSGRPAGETDLPRRQVGAAFAAADGQACLSLLARADSTRQFISLRLEPRALLRRDSSYRLTLSLMQARHNENDLICEGPAVLRVWAYHSRLKRRELLLETDPVSHAAWMSMEFMVTPLEDSYDELILEAGPDPGKDKAYNTNLLIDHILPLTKVKDQEEITRMRRPLPQERKEVASEPARRPVTSLQTAQVKPIRLASGRPSGGEFLWNSSFEDETKMAGVPSGWSNCGFPNESPPDVQPGSFQVVKSARHGNTYLGMVVRDNDSWELVGQQLDQPLLKGQPYLFKAFLAQSEIYMSISQTTYEPANYTTPARLRIWGGYEECGKDEMLAETAVITHIRWIEYPLRIQPQQGDYPYILLEVFYDPATLPPYNGHVLIDQCSLQKVKN